MGCVQCFDSIARIDFGEDEAVSKDILAMNSAEGEKVQFTAPVTAVGNVENWLGEVEEMMRTTLYDLSREAHKWCVCAVAFTACWPYESARVGVLIVAAAFPATRPTEKLL